MQCNSEFCCVYVVLYVVLYVVFEAVRCRCSWNGVLGPKRLVEAAGKGIRHWDKVFIIESCSSAAQIMPQSIRGCIPVMTIS